MQAQANKFIEKGSVESNSDSWEEIVWSDFDVVGICDEFEDFGALRLPL